MLNAWQKLRFAKADVLSRKFFRLAVRPTSGAQALQTSGADAIAGLAGAIHEAGRVRDMRKYPFWARGADALKRCTSPRPERYCAIARRLCRTPKRK